MTMDTLKALLVVLMFVLIAAFLTGILKNAFAKRAQSKDAMRRRALSQAARKDRNG